MRSPSLCLKACPRPHRDRRRSSGASGRHRHRHVAGARCSTAVRATARCRRCSGAVPFPRGWRVLLIFDPSETAWANEVAAFAALPVPRPKISPHAFCKLRCPRLAERTLKPSAMRWAICRGDGRLFLADTGRTLSARASQRCSRASPGAASPDLGRAPGGRRGLPSPRRKPRARPCSRLRRHMEAPLLMSTHSIPPRAGEAGRVVNVISERDLFALQRLSLGRADRRPTARRRPRRVEAAGREIVASPAICSARHASAFRISGLNDGLTERLVQLVSRRRELDLAASWLAFALGRTLGADGRRRPGQRPDVPRAIRSSGDRAAWLAFGSEVNEGLDACRTSLVRGSSQATRRAAYWNWTNLAAPFAGWIDVTPRPTSPPASSSICVRSAAMRVPPLRRHRQAGRGGAAFPQAEWPRTALPHPVAAELARRDRHETDMNSRPMFDLKLQARASSSRRRASTRCAQCIRKRGAGELGDEAVAPKLGATPRESDWWAIASIPPDAAAARPAAGRDER